MGERSGGFIDALVRLPKGEDHIYEVKVTATASGAIREALGQLLEYGYHSTSLNPTKLVVVAPPELDKAAKAYLQRLRAKFSLPLDYLRLEA
jgi:hypothetical protein